MRYDVIKIGDNVFVRDNNYPEEGIVPAKLVELVEAEKLHTAEKRLEEIRSMGETVACDIAQLMQPGKKIHAIKLVRQLTGLGLKDAKDLVEKYIPAPQLHTGQLARDENTWLFQHQTGQRFILNRQDFDPMHETRTIEVIVDCNNVAIFQRYK